MSQNREIGITDIAAEVKGRQAHEVGTRQAVNNRLQGLSADFAYIIAEVQRILGNSHCENSRPDSSTSSDKREYDEDQITEQVKSAILAERDRCAIILELEASLLSGTLQRRRTEASLSPESEEKKMLLISSYLRMAEKIRGEELMHRKDMQRAALRYTRKLCDIVARENPTELSKGVDDLFHTLEFIISPYSGVTEERIQE